jgi:hypothetical protein
MAHSGAEDLGISQFRSPSKAPSPRYGTLWRGGFRDQGSGLGMEGYGLADPAFTIADSGFGLGFQGLGSGAQSIAFRVGHSGPRSRGWGPRVHTCMTGSSSVGMFRSIVDQDL